MGRLTASKTRIPPEDFNKVAYQGERICVERHGKEEIFLVSKEDVELLEAIEDILDIEAAHEALESMRANGEKPVPWEEAKKRLGL
jgi:PHD/YefM family antitoxin component YafN of YafNO toxin-antitoxin module